MLMKIHYLMASLIHKKYNILVLKLEWHVVIYDGHWATFNVIILCSTTEKYGGKCIWWHVFTPLILENNTANDQHIWTHVIPQVNESKPQLIKRDRYFFMGKLPAVWLDPLLIYTDSGRNNWTSSSLNKINTS